jgi:hypothetical protein
LQFRVRLLLAELAKGVWNDAMPGCVLSKSDPQRAGFTLILYLNYINDKKSLTL